MKRNEIELIAMPPKTTWVNAINPQNIPSIYAPPKKTNGYKKTKPEPFLSSKAKLIAVIQQNPCIKPKAACRILGWSGSKLLGVLGHYSDEIGYGLVIKNTDAMANNTALVGG